ncbi:MAG: hypothetical protein HYY06_07195 [Deltaproteobacteria bacterium]|nr:hypothetical protein [Deltaproteobacteria bacterium]
MLAVAGCGGGGGDDEPPAECPGVGTIVDEPLEISASCPGGPDCADEGDDVLWAGAAAVSITPEITETMTVDVDGDSVYDEDEDEFDDANGNGRFDGVWIAGLSSPRPAEGVLEDTWARAIALRQNETTIVLVALDVIGWFYDDVDRIREALPEELGVDYLSVSATHCHQCPDVIGIWGIDELTSGVDPEYNAFVRDQTVLAVRQAVEALEPATITYGQIRTNDFPEKGAANYVSDSRDPVVIDDILRVLRFDGASDGHTIGTLVNWAAHPEYSGDAHRMIHPDYPGWLRRGVEEGIDLGDVSRDGLGGVCVFVNGAIGGQIGPKHVDATAFDGAVYDDYGFGLAEATGTNVAEYVFRALDAGETEETADLSFVATRFYVDILNYRFQTAFLMGIFDREAYNYDPAENIGPDNQPQVLTEEAVIRIGRATAVTIPGELFPELAVGGYDGAFTPPYFPIIMETADPLSPTPEEDPPDLELAPCGPYLAERMDGDYTLMLGLTQDFLGYIIPEYDFKVDARQPYFEEPPAGDHYEETNSLGPHAAQILVGNLQTLLEQ